MGIPNFALWLALLAIALRVWQQTPEPVPTVYFSHVTIDLSPATYQAVRASPFLQNEFSGFEERTTQRDGGKWSYTGIYLYGRHTYLEFEKADPTIATADSQGTRPGNLSFGMWVDDRNQLPLVRNRLVAETGAAEEIAVSKRVRDGKDVTWFDWTAARFPDMPNKEFDSPTWVLSVYPSYLRQMHPDLKPEEEGTTREKQIRDYVPTRLMEDVTDFVFTVSDVEYRRREAEFRAYGYALRSEGDTLIATGPGIRFQLIRAQLNEPRTLAIHFSLTPDKIGVKAYRFGDNSELHFLGDRTGTWTFKFAN